MQKMNKSLTIKEKVGKSEKRNVEHEKIRKIKKRKQIRKQERIKLKITKNKKKKN